VEEMTDLEQNLSNRQWHQTKGPSSDDQWGAASNDEKETQAEDSDENPFANHDPMAYAIAIDEYMNTFDEDGKYYDEYDELDGAERSRQRWEDARERAIQRILSRQEELPEQEKDNLQSVRNKAKELLVE